MSGGSDSKLNASYYRLMVYAAIIGALASLVTTGYITLVNLGIKFFAQPTLILSNINFWPLILLGTTGVFVGLLIKFFGQRGGVGVAQSQYVETGGLNYRNVPSILLQGFIALWGGASIGPEGTLTFLAGGLGTFVSERLKLQKDDVQVLTYSAIAGAFGGFFGSPIVGAVGAVEYMFIKELNLYRHLIPGLIAASVGYGVYSAILHTSFLGVYDFPDFAALRVVDLIWALLVGVIAGAIGILHKLVFGLTHRVFGRLNKKPVIRAIIGGVVIGLIGSFLPLTLYSGQNQLLEIIRNPASFGIGILLLMMLVKILLTGTSFATGFDGGPIFPILFIGGVLGQLLSEVLTFIPQGVGVLAGMAAAACAFLPLPLTIALLLGLFGGQTDLLPVIVIGAVTGFIISKAFTPLLQKHTAQPASNSKQ
ncbi:MAG: chloride channel protein [Nitrososphaeraceae archaeon]